MVVIEQIYEDNKTKADQKLYKLDQKYHETAGIHLMQIRNYTKYYLELTK